MNVYADIVTHPAVRHLLVDDHEYACLSRARARIYVAYVMFCLVLLMIASQLVGFSLAPAKRISRMQNVSTDTSISVWPRADMVDRHGILLARNLPIFSLYAEPHRIWNADIVADKFTALFPDTDRTRILSRLTSERQFVWLKRGLSPRVQKRVLDIGEPGLKFRLESGRIYPHRELAAHFVGFSNVDQKGLAGAERALNEQLNTADQDTVTLSMDLRMQYVLNEELLIGMQKFKAQAAFGLIMDIRSGELLGLSSLPDFDPNNPSASDISHQHNRVTFSTFELGSVFKPITFALALEQGVVSATETLDVHMPVIVQNKAIVDDHASQEALALPDVLARSSNRGAVLLAMRSGAAAQRDFLKLLGLLDRVPIELAESAAPLVPKQWQDITTATIGFGHGIAVTPLALATAIGALLNGGEYVAPTIVRRMPGDVIKTRRVVSQATSTTVRDLMRHVVDSGTGRHAHVPGYRVLGKTGTANKPGLDGYDSGRVVSTFIAAFPHEAPKYLIMVGYDEPQPIAETFGYNGAGWNAAPTAGKIIHRIAPMTHIMRDRPVEQVAHQRQSKVLR